MGWLVVAVYAIACGIFVWVGTLGCLICAGVTAFAVLAGAVAAFVQRQPCENTDEDRAENFRGVVRGHERASDE